MYIAKYFEVTQKDMCNQMIYYFFVHNFRKYWYTAYRQLTRWCWEALGLHNRKVLPSCAVTKIRTEFPSPSDEYTGFANAPLD